MTSTYLLSPAPGLVHESEACVVCGEDRVVKLVPVDWDGWRDFEGDVICCETCGSAYEIDN